MKKLLGILLFISIALSANAQLLWKVSGKGLEKPSYIFGTYHLSPLSIKDSIAAMPQAMNETTPSLRGSCDERNGDSRLHAKHATADDDAQRHHAAKPLYSRAIRRSG